MCSPSSWIIPGMAVVTGHHDAVRELRPEPRARFPLAGERLELDILVAGIFGEAPQVGVGGFYGVHAGVWGRAGRLAAEGAAGHAGDFWPTPAPLFYRPGRTSLSMGSELPFMRVSGLPLPVLHPLRKIPTPPAFLKRAGVHSCTTFRVSGCGGCRFHSNLKTLNLWTDRKKYANIFCIFQVFFHKKVYISVNPSYTLIKGELYDCIIPHCKKSKYGKKENPKGNYPAVRIGYRIHSRIWR